MSTGSKEPKARKKFEYDRAVVSSWLQRLVQIRGPFPEDLLFIDLETNGLNVKDPKVLPSQVGWYEIRKGKVTDSGATILNWELAPNAVPGEFLNSVDLTADRMRQKGLEPAITAERVLREGVDPLDGLPPFLMKVQAAQADGVHLAGHNFFDYDRLILERVVAPVMGGQRLMNPNQVVDTCLLAAGAQRNHGIFPASTPHYAWYEELKRYRNTVASNLGHCVDKFLDGVGVKFAADLHDGLGDCHRSYAVLEAMRDMASISS
jgi:hypothetical protein